MSVLKPGGGNALSQPLSLIWWCLITKASQGQMGGEFSLFRAEAQGYQVRVKALLKLPQPVYFPAYPHPDYLNLPQIGESAKVTDLKVEGRYSLGGGFYGSGYAANLIYADITEEL